MVNEESLRSDLQQMIFETTGIRPLIDYRDDPLVNQMMNGCSKAGTNNRGIPDLVFRIKDILVIIEVKHRINRQTNNEGFSPIRYPIPFSLESEICKNFAENGALSYIYRGVSNVDWDKSGIRAVVSLGISMESKSHFVGRGFIYDISSNDMARMHPFHSYDYFRYESLKKECSFVEIASFLDDSTLDKMCVSFTAYCSKNLKLDVDKYLPELAIILMAKSHISFNSGEMSNDYDYGYILNLCKKTLIDYEIRTETQLVYLFNQVLREKEDYRFPNIPIRAISDFIDFKLGLSEIMYAKFLRRLIGIQCAYNNIISEIIRKEPQTRLFDFSSEFALAAFSIGMYGCDDVPTDDTIDPSTEWITCISPSVRQTVGNSALLYLSRFDTVNCMDVNAFNSIIKKKKASIVVADWFNQKEFDWILFKTSMDLLTKDCLGVFIIRAEVVNDPSLSDLRDEISRRYTVERILKCKGCYIVCIRKSPNRDLTKTTKMIDISRRKTENLPGIVGSMRESDYYRRKLRDGKWFMPK